MKKAMIKTATGDVENVIEIDSDASYTCPEGCELIDIEPGVGPGFRWDGNAFIAPDVEDNLLRSLMAEEQGDISQLSAEDQAVIADRLTQLQPLLEAKLVTNDLSLTELQTLYRLNKG